MDFSDNRNHPVRIQKGRTKTDADGESDDSPAEEETALHLPPEMAELFRSDTENEDFDGFGDAD